MILVAYLRMGSSSQRDDVVRFLQEPLVIQLESFRRSVEGKVKDG
jgi:hypothetical protein